MSYTFDAPDPHAGPDVDFDFFDDPQDRKSPTNLGSSGQWKRDTHLSVSDSEQMDTHTAAGDGRESDKPKPPLGERKGSQEDRRTKKAAKQTTRTDYYSSDDMMNDDVDAHSKTENPKGKGKDIRKIEAKIPTANGDPNKNNDDGRLKQRNDDMRPKTALAQRKDKRIRSRSYSSDSAHSKSSLTDTDYTTDSDVSDVTDVSPLHSPHTPVSAGISRRSQESQRSVLRSGKPPKGPTHKEVTFRRPPSAGNSDSSHRSPLTRGDSDNIDFKLLMQAVIEMEGRSGDMSHSSMLTADRYHKPGSQTAEHRRNMSFSNDSVRTIDRENQRLMQQIMLVSRKAKQKKLAIKNTAKVPMETTNKMSTSALNRKKEQQRIERENFAMLQRLQNAKPAKTLAKDSLIDEYEHQVLFGCSVSAAHPLPRKKPATNRAPSPYVVPFDPKFNPKSRSMTNLIGDCGSEMSGYSAASTTRKTRPASATARSARPQSASSPIKKRPQSAKLQAAGSLTSPGKPKPAWDDRW